MKTYEIICLRYCEQESRVVVFFQIL